MWEAIGAALGGVFAGAVAGWKKENAKAKKVIDALDTAADAAMTSVVDNLAARAIAIADRYSQVASTRLGPGTVLGDLEAKRKAALEEAEEARQAAIADFRRRMAEARAGVIPRSERETKPERVVPGAVP